MKRVFFYVCSMVLLGVICIGCSKKGEETANNSNQITEKLSEQESSTSYEDTSNSDTAAFEEETSVTEAPSIDAEVADVSPWKLLSESSVDTKVFYAGFLNDAIGVTVGYSGETSYTEDGGKTWSKSYNVSACRYGLDLYDETFIVDCGNSGVNLISKDKGKNWSRMGDFPLKNGSYNKFLSAIDTKNIYIGALKSLGRSNDGAVTWNDIALPEGCDKIAGMFFMTTDIGYLLSMEGILYITKDACETWTTQTIDLSGEKISTTAMPSVAINFQDENHGMIVYYAKSFKLSCLKTEDGGITWTSIEMPKTSLAAPYLSRNGQYLTLSSPTRKIGLFKLEKE